MADPRTNLKVTIGGDLAEIKSALASLRGDLAKTQKVADSGNYSRLTSGIKSFVGWLAGGVTVAAFATFAKNLINLGDNLWTIHERTGVAVEDLSKFQGAAEQAGTSVEDVAAGLNKLNKSIGLNDKNAQTMKQLGIDTTNATTAMLGLADVMQRTEDPALRSALAMQLFGKNGAELIPMLAQGRAGIEEMAGAMTTEFAQAADRFNDSLNEMKRNAQGLSSEGMIPVLNAINDVINAFGTMNTKGPEVGGFFSTMATLAKGLGVALNTVWGALRGIGVTLGATAAALTAFFSRDYKGLEAIGKEYRNDISGIYNQTADTNSAILNGSPASGGSNGGPSTRRTGGGSSSYVAGSADAAVRKAVAGAGTKTGGDSAAKRAADARIAEEKRAAEEIRKINEAEEQDRIERDKRISEGLAEVRIDLLRQSGQAAEAAFAEIDAKYAQLLADLRAKGDTEGEATLRKLIGLEKADAELKALDEQIRAVMDNLREQTAFINNASQVPGGITSLEAEEQIRALREQSIAQLTVLREKAMAAYNAAPTAETLARVNELDVAIKGLDDSFTTLLAKTAEDEGVQALSGFFTDLALEAKSFKDAFKDMVRNFVSGIATMVAQQLALNAVKGITRAFGSFHTGGIAGQGGGARRVVDPAVFAAAPRYHGGGVAGLRANEVPAILLKGERVLSPSQTREYDRGSRPSPGTRIVNVFDPSFVPDQMDSAAGEKVILNVIGRNPGRVKQMLG